MARSIFVSRLLRELWKKKIQVIILMLLMGFGGSAWFGMRSAVDWRKELIYNFFDDYGLDDGVINIQQEFGVNQTELLEVLSTFEHLDELDAWDTRYRLSISLEFNDSRGLKVTKAFLYGLPLESFESGEIDTLAIRTGRSLTADDLLESVFLLDDTFRRENDLEINDTVNLRIQETVQTSMIAGGIRSPEWIFLMDPETAVFSLSSSFGVGYALLPTMQSWLNISNNVNQLVFKSSPEVDPEIIGEQLKAHFLANDIIVDFKGRDDFEAHTLVVKDVESDDDAMMSFAIIIFIVAAFSIWISISRLVNHQRREIGIDLSLGTDDNKILLFYLSYGLLIGIFGGIFSTIFGYYVGKGMGSLTDELFNLPSMDTNIRWVFAFQAGGICLAISLLSALWPAWKSSRLLPIAALRQDPSLVPTVKIVTKVITWIFTPIILLSINAKIGLRNVLRNRRRTIAVILGIAFCLGQIIFVLGAMAAFQDSVHIYATDQGEWDLRVTMSVPVTYETTQEITDDIRVTNYHYGLNYFGKIYNGPDTSMVQLLAFSDSSSIPLKLDSSLVENSSTIAISKELAKDLGVKTNDNISLENVVFGSSGNNLKNSTLQITSFHDRVAKFEAIIPMETLQRLMNVTTSSNMLFLDVEPSSESSVRELLYQLPYVRIVEVHDDLSGDIDEMFEEFKGIIYTLYVICFLIAFFVILLTSLITISEREREIGTLSTLGASDRMILNISLWEATFQVIGGIILGFLFGFFLLDQILKEMFSSQYDALIIQIGLPIETWIIVGLIMWVIALISQLPLLRVLRKMDLSQATKIRDC
ncbi:MAG: ABC transporter permease [Candidatus Kariarchaeaceae archaeon]